MKNVFFFLIKDENTMIQGGITDIQMFTDIGMIVDMI